MKKITKVLTLLLFVASLTAMTSCKKVDKNLIVGSWKCSAATLTEYGQPVPYISAVGLVWEFQSDGTLIAELAPEIDIESVTSTYAISGNQLTISYRDDDGDLESETYTINELTKTKLKITENEYEFDDDRITLEFAKL